MSNDEPFFSDLGGGFPTAYRLRGYAASLTLAGDAARMNDLAAALDGGPSAPVWATRPAQSMFNVTSLAEQILRPVAGFNLVRFAEVVRNAMIFLPILFTWWALSKAADAYHQVVDADPTRATDTFLFMWQDGFDERLESLTLSKVAVIDSVLIGSILLLTIVVSVWSNRREDQREREVADLAAEIESVLADASLALAELEPRNPDQAVHLLDSVGKALLDDIREQRQGLTEFTRSQAESSRELGRAMSSLEKATVRVDATAGVLAQSTTEISAFAGQFGAAAEALTETHRELNGTLNQLSSSLEAFLAGHEQSTGRLAQSAEPLSQAASEMAQQGSRLTEAFVNVAGAQDAFLKSLASERDSQDNLARSVSAATVELEQALRAILRHSNDLANLTSDTAELTSAIPGYGRVLQEQLTRAADRQIEAARAIERSVAEALAQTRPAGVAEPASPEEPAGVD